MRHVPNIVVVSACFLVLSCASMGMNSVQKLNQLSPGMSSEEVIKIFGEPKSSQMANGKWILKYTLHENWKGYVPYYIVFDNSTRKLESWYEDEAGYQRLQTQMGELFKPLLQNQGGAATPAGPNDPDLQKWIAGTYYSFTSSMVVSASSERTYVLCGNGKFRITGESSYSGSQGGNGTTGWGSASQSGNSGNWAISGDRQSGTITLSYGNGTTKQVKYRVGSQADQVMYFDDVKFAFAGAAECK
jgi:hypothetical protein